MTDSPWAKRAVLQQAGDDAVRLRVEAGVPRRDEQLRVEPLALPEPLRGQRHLLGAGDVA